MAKSFTGSKIKTESGEESQDKQSRHLKVQFGKDIHEYPIDCAEARTVLEAIKSTKRYKELNLSDDKILIHVYKLAKRIFLATHFPCSCIEEGECLHVSQITKKVEEITVRPARPEQGEKYCVFYIDNKVGQHKKKKDVFIYQGFRNNDCLRVYAKEGMSVKDAMEGDGRFKDLGDFYLSSKLTEKDDLVNDLHIHILNICARPNQGKEPSTSTPKGVSDTEDIKQEGSSVKEPGAEETLKRGEQVAKDSQRPEKVPEEVATVENETTDTQEVVTDDVILTVRLNRRSESNNRTKM